METSIFRNFLSGELRRRQKLNTSYSLRAFARDIDIDPSRLSKIINGKRPVSETLIDHIGKGIPLSSEEVENLKIREFSSVEDEFMQIELAEFEVIQNYVNYAVLELMKTDSFISDIKWISQRLHVSNEDIKASIDRLKIVGLLEIDEYGNWHDLSEGYSTHMIDESFTSLAHRNSQKEILNLANLALDNISIEKRDQSSMMMATSPEKIKNAKLMIKKFRRRLCNFLENTEEKTEIYQLSISLFPLTYEGNENEH